MVQPLQQSLFCRALVSSGLIAPERLEQVVAQGLPAHATVADLDEALLAKLLVDSGDLNAWQVEQLREGRSRFRLGPYLIHDAIGRGGMGDVFQAEHELLGRIEAIKVLPKRKTTPDAVARFAREVRAQAQLDHPNLVRVTFAGADGGAHYFVSEYVPGLDLRRLVRRFGPLPIEAAAHIGVEAAKGLEYAHRKGLVHRDVKPGNVLVTPQGAVKLTDLGLAWRLDDATPPDQGAGTGRRVVGTSDYLAPESIRTPNRVLPVSDVYALGCTVYYAITGKVPYPGGDHAEKARRHLNEAPLSPGAFRSDLPEAFVAALWNMMDKDENRRTPTAVAAAEALLPFVTPGSKASVARVVDVALRRRTAAPDEREDSAWDETAGDSSAVEQHGSNARPDVASQGTDPVCAADQETVPDAKPSETHEAPLDRGVRWTVTAAVAAAGLVGIAALATAWLR
ncbi:Serine/threonine-protein kinase StkP [Pirellulimonas nuda]|uniref:Serine/threonine-protein kinase StkP n=1 Tax=Pirellulimonas nuda TaxID=2528009 RepID=A0A518DB61_9BACT|nr:serine/threonine-protein kinase [Pirellulimonas nuda]QDU88719.1 Serine/threonine-protein kinase StkP [Pirellulimonas nuda]